MATPSLSALLGLAPPPPVISPQALDRRLSATELRAASAAFHRVRGFSDRVDFPRFRDTVLCEAFGAMPLYLMQRVFIVWNYTEGSTGGALSLKEFLVGVAIVWKGTREEHLRFAFQLMDRRGEQELTKRDAVTYLQTVARDGGVVALEEPSGRQWGALEFADLLFPTEKTVLTPAKFVKAINVRSFKSLALIDWIPKIALQFENDEQQLVLPRSVEPVKRAVVREANEVDSLLEAIVLKLRRISSAEYPPSPALSPSAQELSPSGKSPRQADRLEGDGTASLIQVEALTADEFQALKSAVYGLIERVLESNEVLSDADVQECLKDIVSDAVIQATIETAQACAGDFLFTVAPQDEPVVGAISSAGCRTKVRLFWWLLCVCCSCSRSSTEVLRYMFVLFDEECCGFWDESKLATFIQCVDFSNEDQSNEDEATFLARTVLDEIESSKQRVFHDTTSAEEELGVGNSSTVVFCFRDFEEYLRRYPILGCSASEIDLIFTLFHVHLNSVRGSEISHREYVDALQAYCEHLLMHEISSQFGYCLLPHTAWSRVVDWVCDYDSDIPLSGMLKGVLCTTIESPEKVKGTGAANDDSVVLNEEPLTAIPLSLWIVIGSRLNRTPTSYHKTPWYHSATRMVFSMSTTTKTEASDNTTWRFRGFLASLDLTAVAKDGSECRIVAPHCIVDMAISLQAVIQAALLLHGRGKDKRSEKTSFLASHPPGAFYCEGQVVFSAKENQQIHVSRGLLCSALSTLDGNSDSHRVSITMNILLTVDRSASYVSPWPRLPLSSPTGSQASTCSPSSRTPRQKRNAIGGWTNVHGLANLGNTCFMNSALQCLAATPLLRDYFLKGEHLWDISTRVSVNTGGSLLHPGRKPGKPADQLLPKSSLLPVTFAKLLSEMNSFSANGSVPGMSDVVSPTHMKTAIATLFPHLSDGSQQDAQEFLLSLLSSLSDELKRLPIIKSPQSLQPVAPVTSPSLLARFTVKSRSRSDLSSFLNVESSNQMLTKMRFQVHDSNGRSDEVVAKEWWISHLVSEPSVITALFSGQFKSTLRCTNCGFTSTRFEPFSSLQLALQDETAVLSPRMRPQHQHVVVILHAIDTPSQRNSIRIALQVGLDWTISQLLIKLQQEHATFSSNGMRRDHVAVNLNGFIIDDYVDPDALVSSVASPIDVFEIEYGEEARRFADFPSHSTFAEGTKVLARATHDRWIKAVIERPSNPNSTSVSSPRSPSAYYVYIEEARNGSHVCLDKSDIREVTSHRYLMIRFVHRRPGLVPFYSTSPYRQVLCGFPFVCRLPSAMIHGRALYHMIHHKFCGGGASSQTRGFELKRVRSDGKCCGRCHWSEQCDGCPIERLDEELLDLDMDETVAVDWALDTHVTGDDWLLSGCQVEDHTSYVAYKLDNTHSLERSLEMLCTEEQLDARCNHCKGVVSVKQPTDPNDPKASDPPNSSALPSPGVFIPHRKSLALWSLPPILVIQLKRFELVADGGYTYQRLNHSVDFQVEAFDLRNFLAVAEGATTDAQDKERDEVQRAASFLTEKLQFPVDTASRNVTSFSLYGIVNHMGDLSGGHYTAHIRHPDSADWWLVDDASAAPVNPTNLSPSSMAYLLFYVRDDVDPAFLYEDDTTGETTCPPNIQDFYPRQPNVTRVSDAAIRSLCKQDLWSLKEDGKRGDGNCVVM